MKTQTTWALSVAMMVLVGCGEQGARPAAQGRSADAPTAASPTSVAAAPSAAPRETACPALPAPAETARAAATPAKAAPAKTAPAKTATAEGKLAVKRLVVAQGIKGREPVDAASSFSTKEADKIYAFVEIENKDRTASEITVSFEPPSGGPSHGNIKLAVGGEPRWRTWAFTRTARAVGAWTAVVKDSHGEVLARTPFEITL